MSIFFLVFAAFIHSWGYPLVSKTNCYFLLILYDRQIRPLTDRERAQKRPNISKKLILIMSFTSEKGEMAVPHRLLIVGAGLTGSVSAALLRRKFPKELLDITVWEKSRGAGGRMNTNRFPGDSKGLSSVDLGAQYISATSEYYLKSHDRYV